MDEDGVNLVLNRFDKIKSRFRDSFKNDAYSLVYNLVDYYHETKLDNKLKYIKGVKEGKYHFITPQFFENWAEEYKEVLEKFLNDKKEFDLKKIRNSGELYDWDKINERFKQKKIFERFPNFNFEKFKKYVINPPTRLINHRKQTVIIDKFMARKLATGILQMLGDKMDLWLMNVGGEGSGKSCLASQQVLFLYRFLKEVGLINYRYNVKEIIKGSLKDLLDYLVDLNDDSFFNISVLDEAEDLDRSNYRDDDNKKFKSAMRRSRKNLNIIILNTPQVGEIDTSVTLARVNMIFFAKMDYIEDMGLLKKGIAEMYIIPRQKIVYSPIQKRNISRTEIKEALSKQFEKKTDYYKDLPQSIMVQEIKFYDTWGFNEDEYDNYIKQQNKTKQIGNELTLNLNRAYALFRFMPEIKFFFDKKEKKYLTKDEYPKEYGLIRDTTRKINKLFKDNPELLLKMEKIFEYK